MTQSGSRVSSAGTAIHVVAGILSDAQGRVLLAQRAQGSHLAGLWEFPGGKIEPGESAEDALRRELREELAIEIDGVEPIISIPWHYPEKSIVLHALRVREFRGAPHGQQQQQLRWELPGDTPGIPMPPPDRPIVNALRLPSHYAITPEPGSSDVEFLDRLQQVIARGARLIQLRAKTIPVTRLRALAQQVRNEARKAGATLLLNGNLELVRELDLDGVHLPATELLSLDSRSLSPDRWVAVSCHDERELAHAAKIGVDFAVLGPVLSTTSHAGAEPIGWQRFTDLCASAPFPVYALGGMARTHLDAAKAAGAQGIAGISAFWS
jgi:8-oxo-dGTP diphosphatase